jgi:hypothetical protein
MRRSLVDTEVKQGVSPALASGVICFFVGVAVGVGLSMFRDWNWYTPLGPGPAGAAAQTPIPGSSLKMPPVKDVTAEKLGKDFADDADAAKKGYEAKPIILTGEVEQIDADKKEVRLASGDSKIVVLLSVKDLLVPDAGKKFQLSKQAGGKFKSFADKTVVIEFERVDLRPMADKPPEKDKAEKDKDKDTDKDKKDKDKDKDK